MSMTSPSSWEAFFKQYSTEVYRWIDLVVRIDKSFGDVPRIIELNKMRTESHDRLRAAWLSWNNIDEVLEPSRAERARSELNAELEAEWAAVTYQRPPW